MERLKGDLKEGGNFVDKERFREKLFQITLPYVCYGIVVVAGNIIEVPPIAKWMIGKPLKEVTAWVCRKKGTIEEIQTKGE